MTIEEIERTLRTVAENQVQLTTNVTRLASAQLASESRASKLEETQEGFETRQAHLDDAFRQVAESHQLLIEMAQRQEERNEDESQTGGRLDALIDSQIKLTQKVDHLAAEIISFNSWADRIDERLGRMSERMEAHDEQLKRIAERLDLVSERAEAHDEQLSRIVEGLDRMSERADARDEQLRRIAERLERTSEEVRNEHLIMVAKIQAASAEQMSALIAAQTLAMTRPKTRSSKKTQKAAEGD